MATNPDPVNQHKLYMKLNRFRDDNVTTPTSLEQERVESDCAIFFAPADVFPEAQRTVLFNGAGDCLLARDWHVAYAAKGLQQFGPSMTGMDSTRTWLCFWNLHSLELLNSLESVADDFPHLIRLLANCQNTTGGFGGGPHQLSHCAPTYAAVMALAIIGTKEAYEVVDRPALYRFLLSMKDASGGFHMHEDGEVDARAAYAALAVADLCNVLTPELAAGTVEWLLSCQSYEGGFGGEPGTEAHGGYTFCAAAALSILSSLHKADMHGLKNWLVHRQMRLEGGFQGRINKLVDGCYSFWQGAAFALLDIPYIGEEVEGGDDSKMDGSDMDDPSSEPMFDVDRLQRYILRCCQLADGGLRDKPGKPRDHYHTCYCLSGLSIAQHNLSYRATTVHGDLTNLVAATDAKFNIGPAKVLSARSYFLPLPCDHAVFLSTPARSAAPKATADDV